MWTRIQKLKEGQPVVLPPSKRPTAVELPVASRPLARRVARGATLLQQGKSFHATRFIAPSFLGHRGNVAQFQRVRRVRAEDRREIDVASRRCEVKPV
jgi:hypothetical protein